MSEREQDEWQKLKEDLKSVWSLALPPDHRFECESNEVEVTDLLRSRIRAFAESTVRGEEYHDDPEIVALVYRFRNIYEEYGRLCLDVYLRIHKNT